MANVCDSQLYFARDVKVLIEIGPDIWELPVLDGFSFAQANNSSEIVLAEMESTGGVSRRGKRVFNDSLAPAEWSFTTYTRPFVSKGGGAPDADVLANVHAVEEVLWALAAGAAIRAGYGFQGADGTDYFTLGLTGANGGTTIDFNQSNISTLGVANIYFILQDGGLTYKITESAVNEVTINFDIDGIASLEWSGFGAEIVEEPTIKVPTITEGVLDTANFIRNRLTTLSVIPNKDAILTVDVTAGAVTTATITDGGTGYAASGQISLTTTAGGGAGDAILDFTADAAGTIDTLTINTAGTGYTDVIGETISVIDFPSHTEYSPAEEALLQDSYNLTLTGGSITISNNLTYITPEELGVVNIPIGHVTGTRSVGGSFTTYLVTDVNFTNVSADFWEDVKGLKTAVTHDFRLVFSVGGTSLFPQVQFNMPHCHIEVPTHTIDDVISLETTFTGLGTCISAADETTVKYLSDTVSV